MRVLGSMFGGRSEEAIFCKLDNLEKVSRAGLDLLDRIKRGIKDKEVKKEADSVSTLIKKFLSIDLKRARDNRLSKSDVFVMSKSIGNIRIARDSLDRLMDDSDLTYKMLGKELEKSIKRCNLLISDLSFIM